MTDRINNIEKYKPGTREALDAGCTCPVMDNEYGKGYLGDYKKYGFVVNSECPLHGVLGRVRR